MKKIIIILYTILFIINPLLAQKKPVLSLNTLQSWPTIGECKITNDGRYIIYKYKPTEREDLLVIKSVNGNLKKQIKGVRDFYITENSKYLVCYLPNNKIGIYNFETESTDRVIDDIYTYKVSFGGKSSMLFYSTGFNPSSLVIYDLELNKKTVYSNVKSYYTDHCGETVVLDRADSLLWLNLSNYKENVIINNKKVTQVVFDSFGNQIAFLTVDSDVNSLWFYKYGMSKANLQINKFTRGIASSKLLADLKPRFTKGGKHIVFFLADYINVSPSKDSAYNQVSVWKYSDKYIQPDLQERKRSKKYYTAVTAINSNIAIQLDSLDSFASNSERTFGDNYVIRYSNYAETERYWNEQAKQSASLVSIYDGRSSNLVNEQGDYVSDLFLSPAEKYVIWFNEKEKSYWSYDINAGTKKRIFSEDKSIVLLDIIPTAMSNYGVAGWFPGDKYVLIYDQYDIWKIDPTGKQAPVCITNNYGKKHQLIFRVLIREDIFHPGKRIFLSAMDCKTKKNGFFKIRLDHIVDPVLCLMSNHFYYMPVTDVGLFIEQNLRPVKAKNKDIFLVGRQGVQESPNLFTTTDFILFTRISDLSPEKDYNWLTSELITYPLNRGGLGEGILYKPADFDSSKSYPIIFNYYDAKRSRELNIYRRPEYPTGNINIPFYASNGYLIFIPNVYYNSSDNVNGFVNSIESAAKFLMKRSWVDSTRMGLQGHSFGGYITIAVISRSTLFQAASEASGIVNLVSAYNGLFGHNSAQSYYETGQGNIGKTLWDGPELYIKNSPIFNLNQICTPLLMMHNRKDLNVRFEQGVELFTGLRRLNRRVWMLEYNNAEHILIGDDAKDYAIRNKSYFDYFLKGGPIPDWMVNCIPARNKEKN